MATNKIEIDLEVKGADEAIEKIDGVGEAASAMAEAFSTDEATEHIEGLGETASKMADQFSVDNEKLGEGIGELTGSISLAVGSVVALKGAFQAAAAGGVAAWSAILGPLVAVVGAIYGLYEVYQLLSGAAQEAEEAEANMAAASSDLQSKLEALAENGVLPTTKELQRFTESTILAQFAKDDLETSMAKRVLPTMKKYQSLLREERKLNKLLKGEAGEAGAAYIDATRRLPELAVELATARGALTTSLKEYQGQQRELGADIMKSAEQEQEFEERSKDATLARIKENRQRLNSLKIMKSQNDETERQAKLTDVLIRKEQALFEIHLKNNEENQEALNKLDKKLKAELEAIDQKSIISKKALKEEQSINDAENVKQQARDAKRQALYMAASAKRLALQRREQAELSIIRGLELEQLEIEGADREYLLEERYKDELKKAGENQNLKVIAEMKYLNTIARLEIEAEQESERRKQESDARLAREEKQRAEQRANLIYDSLEFDANLSKDATTRELRLLDIKYAKEIELNKHTQEEITELNRRQAIERQNIIDQSIDNQIEKVGEFSSQYGAGLAEAAYSSILFGESFSEATGQILIALGRQAAVQALMETAKGTAALFINPAAAGNHFTAAGMFLGASAAAGVAGKALGGGGGGGSSSASSPTGTPQTAPTPERETAEESAMVFNINFGGAVIYDTQRAAEQALADRITNLQNTRRRGAPRRSF